MTIIYFCYHFAYITYVYLSLNLIPVLMFLLTLYFINIVKNYLFLQYNIAIKFDILIRVSIYISPFDLAFFGISFQL